MHSTMIRKRWNFRIQNRGEVLIPPSQLLIIVDQKLTIEVPTEPLKGLRPLATSFVTQYTVAKSQVLGFLLSPCPSHSINASNYPRFFTITLQEILRTKKKICIRERFIIIPIRIIRVRLYLTKAGNYSQVRKQLYM